MDTTGIEKTKIEEEQRALRRKEKEEGREWERRYFTQVPRNELFEGLAAKIGHVAEPEKTNGIWVFDEEKAAKFPVKVNKE